MPLFSHNQFNDMIIHLRKRIQEVKPTDGKEQTQDQLMEFERLEASIKSLQENLDWLLLYGKSTKKIQSDTPGTKKGNN